jgi:hypothetical protein
MIARRTVPPELRTYLCRVKTRLHAVLGSELLGVYAGGALCLGSYVPGQSRVHVAAVSRRHLGRDPKRRIAEAVQHESIACPARALELVVYAEASAGDPAAAGGPELVLATGATQPLGVELDSGAAPQHRLLIERAILAEHGISLFGPEASQLFAYVPREVVLPALAGSLRGQLENGSPREDAVHQASRALRYTREGRWCTMHDAAPALDNWDARAFLAQVARELGTAR